MFLRSLFFGAIVVSFLALWTTPVLADTDFDGDGFNDLALFEPRARKALFRLSSTGSIVASTAYETAEAPLLGDADGDNIADLVLFNRQTGAFKITKSSDAQLLNFDFCSASDVPLLADLDGDGQVSAICYRPSLSRFLIDNNFDGTIDMQDTIGSVASNVPFAGDINGDGNDDLGVYNRSTNLWTVKRTGGSTITFTFGLSGMSPFLADFNGDGDDDPALYDRARGAFYFATSYPTNGSLVSNVQTNFFGLPGLDLPFLGANVAGTAATDLTVVRPTTSTVFVNVDGNNAGQSNANGVTFTLPYTTQAAALQTSAPLATILPRKMLLPLTTQRVFFDRSSNVRGDWDGDGRADLVTVTRNTTFGTATFDLLTLDGSRMQVVLPAPPAAWVPASSAHSAAVAGDWDGDGRTEPATATVLTNLDPAVIYWQIWDPNVAGGVRTAFWGLNGDTPVPYCDVDGDGITDITVTRDEGESGFFKRWYVIKSTGGVIDSYIHGLKTGFFGAGSFDKPFCADVDGDGITEFIVVRTFQTGGSDLTYWYHQSPTGDSGSNTVETQWGIRGDTFRIGDGDGDGKADFFATRAAANGQLTTFARFQKGDTQQLDWGLSTLSDVVAVGDFYGGNLGVFDVTVYRPGSIGTQLTRYGNGTTGQAIYGVGGQWLVLPSGDVAVIPTPGTPSTPSNPGGAGCDATPGTPTDFTDGGNGALWKPDSEGVSNEAPVILLPANPYRNANITFLGSDGNVVTGIQRTRCCPNGNRMHWWSQKTDDQLAADRPITVKVEVNGQTECRVVPDPRVRYD